MGFQMGEDDRPFSQRMWGLGRGGMSPTPGGRRGCMFMLAAVLAIVTISVIILVVVGAF
jgi:hypothetical protein